MRYERLEMSGPHSSDLKCCQALQGIVDLQAAINRYLAETNADPKPFTWTADPDAIIKKVRRGKQALESIH
jgi:hypothetical protein